MLGKIIQYVYCIQNLQFMAYVGFYHVAPALYFAKKNVNLAMIISTLQVLVLYDVHRTWLWSSLCL